MKNHGKNQMKNSSYIVKQLIGTSIFFLVPFISAGSVFYWQAWLYVILGFAMFALGQTTLAIGEDLKQERNKAGSGAKQWDKIILLLSFLLTIAMFITAGLDSGRYKSSPDFPVMAYLLGFVMTGVGQFLFLLAQKQNKFFSSTVRIQSDRGHKGCSTGLYSIVRHPAYLGSVIQALGFPLIFGSLWSSIPVAMSLLLLILRTALEDKTLLNELNGYREYSQKTKYKLFPFIW